MYNSVWLCMTLHDFVRLFMTLYDSVSLCINLYDPVQLCMTLYDSERISDTLYNSVSIRFMLHEFVLSYMILYKQKSVGLYIMLVTLKNSGTPYGSVWLCVILYDFIWLCMTSQKFAWLSITLHDYIWWLYFTLCITLCKSIWFCMIQYDCLCFYHEYWTFFMGVNMTSWANATVKLHSQVYFESQNILGPKKCWAQKSFDFNKIWVQKFFLV